MTLFGCAPFYSVLFTRSSVVSQPVGLQVSPRLPPFHFPSSCFIAVWSQNRSAEHPSSFHEQRKRRMSEAETKYLSDVGALDDTKEGHVKKVCVCIITWQLSWQSALPCVTRSLVIPLTRTALLLTFPHWNPIITAGLVGELHLACVFWVLHSFVPFLLLRHGSESQKERQCCLHCFQARHSTAEG